MQERQFKEMITTICDRQGIDLSAYSDGWILRLSKDGSERLIVGSSLDLNSQVSAATAKDKAAASALLAESGVEHVRHHVLRSTDKAAMNEDRLAVMLGHGRVVLKPLEGSKGDLVRLISDSASARALVERYDPMPWAISPYVQIKAEYRLVVVDGAVALAYVKTDPVLIDGIAFFNLSKGARATPLSVNDLPVEMRDLAVTATEILGLRLAAVDIIMTKDGSLQVLEINASFSLMHYAKTNPATYEEVTGLYDSLIESMFATAR